MAQEPPPAPMPTISSDSIKVTEASSLEAHPGELIYHVCGSFHCEGKHGVAEMLKAYRPQARSLTVVVIAADDCDAFREEHRGKGDFVLLTDANLPRSHNYYGHSG